MVARRGSPSLPEPPPQTRPRSGQVASAEPGRALSSSNPKSPLVQRSAQARLGRITCTNLCEGVWPVGGTRRSLCTPQHQGREMLALKSVSRENVPKPVRLWCARVAPQRAR